MSAGAGEAVLHSNSPSINTNTAPAVWLVWLTAYNDALARRSPSQPVTQSSEVQT